MIRYTLRRGPGGRRYSSTDRAAARVLDLAGAPETLSDATIAAMTDPDGIRAVIDVLFELESNRLGRPVTTRLLANGVEVAPGSGDLASITNGRRNATATDPPVVFPAGVTAADDTPQVELTWDDVRPVNLVEVHGDPDVGQITSASVDVLDDADVWQHAGSGGGVGRLAVRLFDTYMTRGVRVWIEATEGSDVGVVEVDPMLILDVSDDVESLELEWSREADPGSSPSPVGNYEASSMSVTLSNTDGFWNPASNASLDIGHRIEVAVGIRRPPAGDEPPGPDVEELLPAGVFYSEPFDSDSEAVTVTIAAVDRLGRDADTAVAEEVAVDDTVEEIVRRLAVKYLDLDGEQVVVSPTIGAVVIPYAYPSGTLGSYLADLAKATAGTVHIDPLERLVFARRTDTTDDPVVELTDADALIRHRRPPGFDVTTSIVTVTAAPLTPADVADLWAMPAGGITVPVGESFTLVARYESPPAVDGFVDGVVADGDYTITSAAFYADRAEVVIRNDEPAVPLVVADLRVRGNALVDGSLTARREHVPSTRRYGPRELSIDARLIQTQLQLETVAEVLLDAFRSLDDDGLRRLPDVSFDALGILHATPGDRVTLRDPTKGLAGDYTILARKLTYAGGALLLNDVRVREAPSDVFLVLNASRIDDVAVLGY